MTVPASKEKGNLPTEPKEQTPTTLPIRQLKNVFSILTEGRQIWSVVITCPLSIINTFHFHYVLFFLVTTPCSSPHLLCVLFYAFPQLSCVSYLVLFLDRKAYKKNWFNFYNQYVSTYIYIHIHIYINVLKEINGHYDGIGGDSFLCLILPTSFQLQVKNNKC